MLSLYNYDIVFQEVPGEVSLALNIAGCPNRCEGCHSPHLRGDVGEPLDEAAMAALLERYGGAVTCVCFMGGDGDPRQVERLAEFVHRQGGLRTAWYSGRPHLPEGVALANFDYIKLGPYIPALGGLRSPATNQRMYRVVDGRMEDITGLF